MVENGSIYTTEAKNEGQGGETRQTLNNELPPQRLLKEPAVARKIYEKCNIYFFTVLVTLLTILAPLSLRNFSTFARVGVALAELKSAVGDTQTTRPASTDMELPRNNDHTTVHEMRFLTVATSSSKSSERP